jgi:uncharacterized protein
MSTPHPCAHAAGSLTHLLGVWVLALFASALLAVAPAEAAPIGLVTGSERGTYIQIGRDLARLVAQPAGITLNALPSDGSAANVQRLRNEAGVRLALVQSDVYQAYLDEAKNGNAQAAKVIRPLKVVMPLYDEEIYFVTRADSPLNFVHEIENKRINIGPLGSGTALSATTLYRQMFGAAIGKENTSFLHNEEALLKLATDSTIDVVMVVAGQPAKLFAEMKPEARQYIKLLRLDPNAAATSAALGTYQAAAIRAASYPNWLTADVPTLTTKAMLVTYDYRIGGQVQQDLTRLAQSLCTQFDRLRSEGHPKWQEVSMSLPPLGAGWSYYAPTARALGSCAASTLGRARLAAGAAADAATAAACPADRMVLGLCAPPAAKR